MQQAFFTGLAGLLTFSKSLDNISNNISNMNTAGYRGSDVFYKSLSNDGKGIGASIGGETMRLESGGVRQTGSSTDLAISGQGYFILKGEHGYFYTRAGNFEFNNEGILTDNSTGFAVQSMNDKGALTDITVATKESLPPEVTTEVNFAGNLSTDDTEHSITNVTVFNTAGEAVKLTLNFTNNKSVTPGSWLIDIKDAAGTVIQSAELTFNPDGSPNVSSLILTLPSSEQVTLKFGTENTLDGSTSFSGGTVSTLGATVKDGYALAGMMGVSFSPEGELKLLYSNGEIVDGGRIGLAYFSNEQDLKRVDGVYYEAQTGNEPKLGFANEQQFGGIIGSSLELSNVELSKEFADMIIVQRGYQASSRVMNIANQLIDTLYENTRG